MVVFNVGTFLCFLEVKKILAITLRNVSKYDSQKAESQRLESFTESYCKNDSSFFGSGQLFIIARSLSPDIIIATHIPLQGLQISVHVPVYLCTSLCDLYNCECWIFYFFLLFFVWGFGQPFEALKLTSKTQFPSVCNTFDVGNVDIHH